MSSRITSSNKTQKQMKRSKSTSLAAVALALSAAASVPPTASAFVPSQTHYTSVPAAAAATSATNLHAATAEGNDHADAESSSRRDVLRSSMGALFAGLAAGTALVSHPEAASATYSAYANREKDWEDRTKAGGKFVCQYCQARCRCDLLIVV